MKNRPIRESFFCWYFQYFYNLHLNHKVNKPLDKWFVWHLLFRTARIISSIEPNRLVLVRKYVRRSDYDIYKVTLPNVVSWQFLPLSEPISISLFFFKMRESLIVNEKEKYSYHLTCCSLQCLRCCWKTVIIVNGHIPCKQIRHSMWNQWWKENSLLWMLHEFYFS